MAENFYTTPVIQQPVPQQVLPAQQVQQVPVQNQNLPQFPQSAFQKPAAGPNIWYRAVSVQDYQKISEIGTVSIIVRFLPGINQSGCYEALFEKNTANGKFPNSQRWLVPVLVLSDPLHPEKNGFVGVLELSKTLHQRIKSKATPQNYFDFNTGHNFHINVTMAQMQTKQGVQTFPDYKASGFEAQPSQCNVKYVHPKMVEGKFADFVTFMTRINNPQPKAAVAAPQFAPQQTPVFGQQVPVMQVAATPFDPQAQLTNSGSEAEFNQIFGATN